MESFVISGDTYVPTGQVFDAPATHAGLKENEVVYGFVSEKLYDRDIAVAIMQNGSGELTAFLREERTLFGRQRVTWSKVIVVRHGAINLPLVECEPMPYFAGPTPVKGDQRDTLTLSRRAQGED